VSECVARAQAKGREHATDLHEHCPFVSLAISRYRGVSVEDEKWHGRGRRFDPDQVHQVSQQRFQSRNRTSTKSVPSFRLEHFAQRPFVFDGLRKLFLAIGHNPFYRRRAYTLARQLFHHLHGPQLLHSLFLRHPDLPGRFRSQTCCCFSLVLHQFREYAIIADG
jgi:hypothetical protein